MKPTKWIVGAACGIGLFSAVAPAVLAQRDQGVSARTGLEQLAKQFGPDRIEWIVEMRGFDGIPEPQEWEVVAFDPSTPYLTRDYWVGDREASDEGASDEYFPSRSPFGYFRVSELKLDSKAAFTIAEGEARKARMGFDSLNYFLRCREFSREPVWTLELVDAEEELAGKVYISGVTGEVLRTVWIYRGSRGRPDGGPLVVDSAGPRPAGETTSSGARSENASPSGQGDPSLRQFTPGEPDPLNPGTPAPMPRPEPNPGSSSNSPFTNPENRPLPPPNPGTDTRIPPPPIPPAP